MKKHQVLTLENIEKHILTIRGEKVLLDSDVALFYGVETKRVNEAIRNNPDKFPAGYVIELDRAENSLMKSKISTSLKAGGKVKLPKAFTEKGLYMLATILKSPLATATTLAIVETYAKMRELSRTVATLAETKDPETQKSLMQRSGEIFSDVLGEAMQKTDVETTFELNLAVMKFKHTVRRKGDL